MMRICVICYGDRFTSSFIKATLPSLLWQRDELTDAVLHFYTTPADHEALINDVAKLSIDVQFHCGAKGTKGEILQKSLIEHLERCVASNAEFLMIPPDSIFSDGSIAAIRAIAGIAQGRCVSIPHVRVNLESFLPEFTGEKMSTPALVEMAFRHLHPSWSQAEIPAGKANCWASGTSWTRLQRGLYAVTHRLPTPYFVRPLKSDIDWFKSQSTLGVWDHLWPAQLVDAGRQRIIGSSDAAFVVELTPKAENIPPVVDALPREPDRYKGMMGHHRANANMVAIWRAQ